MGKRGEMLTRLVDGWLWIVKGQTREILESRAARRREDEELARLWNEYEALGETVDGIPEPERFKAADERWGPGEGYEAAIRVIDGRFATGCSGYAVKPDPDAAYRAGHHGIRSKEEELGIFAFISESRLRHMLEGRRAGAFTWEGLARCFHQLEIAKGGGVTRGMCQAQLHDGE